MKQRGISLVIVLVLLTIVLGLGATALRTASADTRLADGERDRQLAFEAATAALRAGEARVVAAAPPADAFDAGCRDGLCLPATDGVPQWRRVDWSGAATIAWTGGSDAYPQPGLLRGPRYLIERLPALPGGTPYRITAAGWGRNAGTEVRLQSVYLAGGNSPPRRLSWRQER